MTIPLDLTSNRVLGTQPSTKRQPRADVERLSALKSGTIGEMYDLYRRYYDSTSLQLFESDLKDKDFVVVLKDETASVVGFSSLALLNAEIDGQRIRAIYSGDTIIDRAHWGTQALAFTWIRFAGTVKARGARLSALLVPDRQGPSHLSLPLGIFGRVLSALADADAGLGALHHGRARAPALRRRLRRGARRACRFRDRAVTCKSDLGRDRARRGGAPRRGVLPAQQSRLHAAATSSCA